MYCADDGAGEVIGYATISKKTIALPDDVEDGVRFRTLLICWFAVAYHHQGRHQGVSHAENMVSDLSEMARAASLAGFSAYVDDRNLRGLHFWERMGFEPLQGHPPNLEEDGSRNMLYILFFPRN